MAGTWLLANAAGPPVHRLGLEVPATHPIANFVAQGSHPDLRVLMRLAREKTDDLARSISIDQVRSLQSLFATTPSFSHRRVVIIDAIDDLERRPPMPFSRISRNRRPARPSSSSAMPPAACCRRSARAAALLRFGRLSTQAMTTVLQNELPEEPLDEIAALARVGEGATRPSAALRRPRHRRARQGDRPAGREWAIPPTPSDSALAKQLGTKAVQARYEAFLERAPRADSGRSEKAFGRGAAKCDRFVGAGPQDQRRGDPSVRSTSRRPCSNWRRCWRGLAPA